MEQATFWVALGTLFARVFALIATVAYGEISRRKRPVLQVVDIQLLDLDEVEAVQELVTDVMQERREAEEEAEAVKDPFDYLRPTLYLNNPRAPGNYEGPLPDKVLRVKIGNTGRSAAYQVTGWVHLDSTHLEPLDYFADGGTDRTSGGEFRVEVGSGRGSNLLHPPSDVLLHTSNDALFYDIAVKVRAPGTTRVRYAFGAHAGKGAAGARDLTVPPV